MNRRSLLLAAGSALGFLAAPFQRSLKSPVCGDAIGKPISAVVETQFVLHASPFETPPSHRYVQFPVENVVTVEYEKGFEKWVTFNMSTDDVASFTMKEFLNSKYERNQVKAAGGEILYRGSRFRLHLLSVKDGVSAEDSNNIYEETL